ncbi:MAG: efflux RND transporter periplasmic adaptor subunit [Acidobacteriota bacterium]
MKRIAVILLLAAFLSVLGWRLYEELASDASLNGPGGGRFRGASMLVEIAHVQPALFESRLEALGELTPKAEVEVMSRVSGRLEEVLVDRGTEVRKGQLLATVEDDEILKQIQRAEASLAVTRAGVKKAEATQTNLEVQVRRFEELYQAGLISPQELEDRESRLRVAEADTELARAQVRQAEAGLSELKIQHRNSRIYSPLDGVVGTRYLDPGALVSAGVPIVSILNMDQLETVVPVAESIIQRIRLGLPTEIVSDAYPELIYHGSVTRISPFLDPETRSADIEIEIANPGHTLKPGMFVRVRIDVNVSRQAASIPRSGLVMRGAQQGVFQLTQENTVRFQPVEVGTIDGDTVEVLSGLEEGAEIVTTGAQNLNEGDSVRTPLRTPLRTQ